MADSERPLQFTIVTTILGVAASIWRIPAVRFTGMLGLFALLCVIVTFQFVRNPSNPMLPEQLHQHGNEELAHSHKSGLNAKDWARLPDMVNGTARKPYVNRALMPWMIRGLRAAMPQSLKERINGEFYNHKTVQLSLKEIGLDWEQKHFTEYLLAMVLLFFMLLGFVYSLRYLCQVVYDGPNWLPDTLAVVSLLGLPPFFELYGSYIYDFSSLFLFTLGLALIVQRRWILFLMVFALGTLNKETTMLLTFAFCMFHTFSGRLTWKTFFTLSLLQVFIFLGIKFGLGLMHHANEGGAVEFHMLRNMSKLPRWELSTIVAALVLLVGCAWNWRGKPLFLRSAMIILVPLIVLTFFFGYFDELRDYYEAYPLVLLLLVHTTAGLLKFPLETRPNAAAV